MLDRTSVDTAADIPRLFYYDTTSETVTNFDMALDGGIPSGQCCVVVESEDGLTELESIIEKDFGPDDEVFTVICAAEIYENMFAQVRQWIRMDFAAAEIQQILDKKFETVSAEMEDVKKKVEVSEQVEAHLREVTKSMVTKAPKPPSRERSEVLEKRSPRRPDLEDV